MKSVLRNLFDTVKEKFFTKSEPFVCVAIGDSTVEGIGATSPHTSFSSLVFRGIKEEINNAIFYNFGKNGAKVEDVIKSQIASAIEAQPDVILISIGANDVIRFTKLEKFERMFQKLINILTTQTNALLVINNIPDISLAPVFPSFLSPFLNMQVKRFNKKILQEISNTKHVSIDIYSHSKVLKGFKQFVSADGLHPSDAGYAVWAFLILSQILPTLKGS